MSDSAVTLPSSRRLLIVILLALASVHCALCIFAVNVSVVELKSYAQGSERLPYQSRVGMMPVLRFAGDNSLLNDLSRKFEIKRAQGSFGVTHEPLSPEKLTCVGIGVLSMLAMTALATAFGWRRYPAFGWVAGVLLLLVFYVSYAARAEANFWYPYDLPHCAIFGAACLSILNGAWIAFLAFFLLDMPFRETGIFLLPAVLLLSWHASEFKKGLMVSAAALALWIPFRIQIMHLFANNSTELGIHGSQMFHAIVNPLHWPQMASALGFLLVPLFLWRHHLSRREQLFIWAAIPGFIVTLAFGVWFESRIFNEWAVAVATLVTIQLAVLLKQHKNSESFTVREVAARKRAVADAA